MPPIGPQGPPIGGAVTLELGTRDTARIIFATPEYGVAPGQAAVLYAGDLVLGGGWIAGTRPA